MSSELCEGNHYQKVFKAGSMSFLKNHGKLFSKILFVVYFMSCLCDAHSIPVTVKQPANQNFTSPSALEKQFIMSAIQDPNSKGKNPKLVTRNGQETDYVPVISGRGCYSNLGSVGGQQKLNLQKKGCLGEGTIQHEFIHAAGFTHEHNRPDRDEYIKNLQGNIPPEWQSQYEKNNERDFGASEPYDYYSIKHYPNSSPVSGKDASTTFSGIDKIPVGDTKTLSERDIAAVHKVHS